jgi:hypothetical protein
MNEQMHVRQLLGPETTAKGQYFFDITTIGDDMIGRLLDHIIEPQFNTLVFAERAEHRQFRRARVEYRKDVAYADLAVIAEFIDAAYRNPEWHYVAGSRYQALPPVGREKFGVMGILRHRATP